MRRITLSIDVEQDCPPFLQSMAGVEVGLPRLLKALQSNGVSATFFTTGRVAECHPRLVDQIPSQGHELGCHGYSHARFDLISDGDAHDEVSKAVNALRRIEKDLVSFRAPNLRFPDKYLPLLQAHGFRIDSSIASYKPPFALSTYRVGRITRVPVTVTSSVLRLPLSLVLPLLSVFDDMVLFAHPWEFIDMSGSGIRYDCRFNTGQKAVENLIAIIRHLKAQNYQFVTMKDRLLTTVALSQPSRKERRLAKDA